MKVTQAIEISAIVFLKEAEKLIRESFKKKIRT